MIDLKVAEAAVLDFEGLPILKRPRHPPEPTGVALDVPGVRPVYHAWGHPSGNTCGYERGRQAIGELFASGRPILTHNRKFDLAVACEGMGLPAPKGVVHDTLPMLFLADPRAPTYTLKDSGIRLLGQNPDQRDAVVEWLIAHQPVPGVKLTRAKNGKLKDGSGVTTYAGAYIAFAPADVAGPYALEDLATTRALARKLWPELKRRKMLDAYRRELQAIQVAEVMERRGIRVDVARLSRDVSQYRGLQVKLDGWLRQRLRIGTDVNLDSDAQLTEVLLQRKLLDPTRCLYTANGKVSLNKESLPLCVDDKQLVSVLRYRAALGTCLKTFMIPWLDQALVTNGRIYTEWNTTRSAGEHSFGARTGRLSSTPNLQNIPNEFRPLFAHEVVQLITALASLGRGLSPRQRVELAELRVLPRAPFELLPLPVVRSYVIPEEGHVLIDRDYSQQEPRILAHFEDGELKAMYDANPWMDIHDYAKTEIDKSTGRTWDRKPVKNTVLGVIYGQGVALLAQKSGLEFREAKLLKAELYKLVPGLKDLYDEMKEIAKLGEPIVTWGGREYYCEESREVDGRLWNFDYKLLNLLIQGSAADCTKEAAIAYQATAESAWWLVLQVHDQLTASVPVADLVPAMAHLQRCMEGVGFRVPMLTEGKWSARSWADLVDYDKKGKIVYQPSRKR